MSPAVLLPSVLFVALLVSIYPWTLHYDKRPTVRFLTTMVLASAFIVISQVALSQALHRGYVLAVTLVTIAALALGRVTYRLIARSRDGRREPAALALPTGTVKSSWMASWSARVGLAPPTLVGVALGLVTALAYAALVGIVAIVPPYGWDTLVYHLTDVFYAIQTASLDIFPYPSRHFYFTKVGELHSLWFYLLAGPSERSLAAVVIGLIPFGLTAGLGVRAAAEALGLKVALPWIVPAVMLTPVVMIQPVSGYVDVGLAAFILAALAYAVLAAIEGRFAHLAFCALASGLAFGVKFSFLYFGATVLLVLVSRRALRGLTRGGWGIGTLRAAVLAVLFASGCAFWLGRNWVRYGNPFYPTRVQVAGVTVFDGTRDLHPSKKQQEWFVPSTASWARYPFYETFHGEPRYTLESGFGPLFAVGVMATLIMAFVALRRRLWLHLRVLLALPITIALWLTVNPYQEPRYIIAACGFALLALAMLAEGARPSRVAIADGRETGRGPAIALHAMVSIAIVVTAAGSVGALAPKLPAVLAEWKAGRWSPGRYLPIEYGTAGDAFNWFNEASGQGKTASFANDIFVAPLFGWDCRNRVTYTPLSGDSSIGDLPRRTTYRSWRKFLHDSGVDWVVEWLPWWEGEGKRRAQEWIELHPDDFRLLEDFGGRARVYAPVFTPAEVAGLQTLGDGPDLADLDHPDAWTLEYREGMAASVSSERSPIASPDPVFSDRPEGTNGEVLVSAVAPAQAAPFAGIRIDFEFQSPENSYCDFRTDAAEGDWSGYSTLSFDVESETDVPAYLFVYLKDRDPRQACRYRIELDGGSRERRRVTLDLSAPEWSKPGFSLDRMAEIHVVVDDVEERAPGKGVLRLGSFRLEGNNTVTRERAAQSGRNG
ncbi:MAG: hypothetical protein AB1714_02840 [Acidobacteriota bacterium]